MTDKSTNAPPRQYEGEASQDNHGNRDPAIQGNGGDAHTYATSCELVRGFGLSSSDALTLLRQWNVRCEPPWSEEDLAKKVRNAELYGSGAIGSKLDAPRPSVWSPTYR
ncbi:MAG: hypothetical protein ACYCW6_17955, partial [Candidatus Xenobia bacterium]